MIMEIDDVKNKMLEYRDLLGQPLIGSDRIRESKTTDELGEIIDQHSEHLEGVINDVQHSLERFKTRIGLGFK